MKKIGIVLVVLLVALLFLSFTKDIVIKTAVEKGVYAVTGLRLGIRMMKVGLIKTMVDIRGLQLYNPKEFKDRLMMDMPEIYVDYDLGDALKGKIHLYDMRINLKEFVVIKNENGELNLDSLKVVQEQKGEARPAEKKEGKAPEVQIDNLELKIGKAIYKDYSAGGEPKIKEFDIDLNEKYQNIDNPQALVSLIVVKVMTKTTIARLTNFDISTIENVASEALGTAEKVAAKATETAAQALGKTTEVTEGAVEKTTEVLKDTAKGLGEAFSLPFGRSREEE